VDREDPLFLCDVTIGEGAVLGAKAGVMSNVPAGERWGGFPAEPAIDWKRGQATLRRLVRRGKAERRDRDSEGEEER
jgi:UDP-3-O-[3-hydroxymyristoyl] glucosamine N-acyltransferase